MLLSYRDLSGNKKTATGAALNTKAATRAASNLFRSHLSIENDSVKGGLKIYLIGSFPI